MRMKVQCENVLEQTAPSTASNFAVIGCSEVAEAASVKIRDGFAAPSNDPVNAVFSTSVTIPVGQVGHWRFEVPTEGVTVDVGMARELGEGWASHSYKQMSGGNFAGQGLIQGSWGHEIKIPGVVDWYLERLSETKVVVYSLYNNNVQDNHAEINFQKSETVDALKPSVTFVLDESYIPRTPGAHCNVRVYRPFPITPQMQRQYAGGQAARTSAEGTWNFCDESRDPAVITVKDGNLFLKVANCITPQIKLADSATAQSGRLIKTPEVGPFTTRMLPVGAAAEVEQWIMNEWIPNCGETWSVADGILTIGIHKFKPQGSKHAIVQAADNYIEN